MALILLLAACDAPPGGKDTADTGDTAGNPGDTAIEEVPWSDTPFVGDPRACAWGWLLWDGAGDWLVQIALPMTRDRGADATDFAVDAAFPGQAELVVVAGSSVWDDAALVEYCKFETHDPSSYETPGTWWFATAGRVSLDATWVETRDDNGEDCGPDERFSFDVATSGVVVDGGTALPDGSWTGLDVWFAGCPPE